MLDQTKLNIYILYVICVIRERETDRETELDIPVTPITLARKFTKQRMGQCALRPLCVVEQEA